MLTEAAPQATARRQSCHRRVLPLQNLAAVGIANAHSHAIHDDFLSDCRRDADTAAHDVVWPESGKVSDYVNSKTRENESIVPGRRNGRIGRRVARE